MNKEIFWMVWREATSDMTYRHPTQKRAEDEAGRLALSCPGEKFYVLKAEFYVTKNEVERVDLTEGIPF